MIKVLAFDMGEVIFTNDWNYDSPEKTKAYCDYFHVSEEQLEDGFNAGWPQFEQGKISEDEFWNIFLTTAGAKNSDIKQAKIFWREYFGVKPGMFDILDKVKKNFRLVIISTTAKEWLDFKIDTYHLNDYFSDYFTSCGMSMKKTDPKMFEQVLKTLKIKPSEMLFVDDNAHVSATAESVGIQSILFRDATQLTEEFKKRNVM